MKKTVISACLSFVACVASADVAGVRISSRFGHDPSDSTDIIQKAIDSGERVLILDKAPGPWVSGPLRLRSDLTLLFEDGVELLAKRGEFKGRKDAFIACDRVTNVTIRGLGRTGGVVRMRKEDYRNPKLYVKAEWRHCIDLRRSVNAVVENMTLKESGGDGICIGGNCANVTIRRVRCDGNYRQGISACSFTNLLIEDCVLSNTKGTPPEAGLDIEPDLWYHKATGIVLRNVLSENNAGSGFEVMLHNLRRRSLPPSIVFENCRAVGCRDGVVIAGNHVRENDVVRGSLAFIGCSFENNAGNGIIVTGVPEDSLDVRFEGCKVVQSPASRKAAVHFKTTGPVQGFPGNVRFGSFRVEQKKSGSWFSSFGSGLGPSPRGLRGTVTVAGPDGREETVVLDDAWREKNFPVTAGGVRPAPPEPRQVFPRVKAVDLLPGALAELSPVGTFSFAKAYLVLIERPGKAVFHVRQMEGSLGKARARTAVVYRMSLRADEILPPDHRAEIGRIRVPADVSSVMSFVFEKPGLFEIVFPSSGCPVMMEKSSVPIGVDLSDWRPSFATGQKRPFDLWFHVSGRKRFSVISGHNLYYGCKAEVFRPDGSLYASGDNRTTGVFLCDVPAEDALEGLWSVRFSAAGSGVFELVSAGLGGLPPVLFLSDKKYWTSVK